MAEVNPYAAFKAAIDDVQQAEKSEVLATRWQRSALLNLLDALFIFGAQRRCVHDYIANTKVVQV